jgi:PAS domain S-box-containing protein
MRFMSQQSDHSGFLENEHSKLLEQALHAGLFQISENEESLRCSPAFCDLLGYPNNTNNLSKSFFFDQLVLPADREILLKAIQNNFQSGKHFLLEIQLLHKGGAYKWFKIAGNTKQTSDGPAYMHCSITDINERVEQKIALQKSEYLLAEAGKMARIGVWELYTNPPLLTWSKEVCHIHEVPENFTPDLNTAINFYSPPAIPRIQQAVNDALSQGTPFDLELKIITATQKEIWVRAIGKAIYADNTADIVGVRGVFQDINEQKEKQVAIDESTKIITSQNKRLVNFAHIVSHNLRAHAANLSLSLELQADETDPVQKSKLQENIQKISASLNETIAQLKDLVVAQTETHEIKKRVALDKVMKHVEDVLQAEIHKSNATLKVNFSKCTEIDFVPAYLESILLNFTSNALKYRNPDVPLVITIESDVEAGKPILKVSDNGLGIDLEKHGEHLFGMYKTFHGNPTARGIGLFMTKNQVESLGGKISVESELNKGTVFKIHF